MTFSNAFSFLEHVVTASIGGKYKWNLMYLKRDILCNMKTSFLWTFIKASIQIFFRLQLFSVTMHTGRLLVVRKARSLHFRQYN